MTPGKYLASVLFLAPRDNFIQIAFQKCPVAQSPDYFMENSKTELLSIVCISNVKGVKDGKKKRMVLLRN